MKARKERAMKREGTHKNRLAREVTTWKVEHFTMCHKRIGNQECKDVSKAQLCKSQFADKTLRKSTTLSNLLIEQREPNLAFAKLL